MEHGPGRVRMGTRRGTLSFIELPVDTGRRGYMICVPINIGCCCSSRVIKDFGIKMMAKEKMSSPSGRARRVEHYP